MAAGTAYAKRFAGGFADNAVGGTPIDSAFLNAVETALLQLIGAAPTVDGQVAQWDNANTRFGPALLLNKNVDPAAAIAKSKLDFTGANGIVNADIAGAAAIARSKLSFGSGLVDADIAAAAALAIAKLAGYPADGTKVLKGDGTWGTPTGLVGVELDYKQITADVAGIVATTEGTAAAVITANSITYDGTRVKLEFFAPGCDNTGNGVTTTFVFLRDTTPIGQFRSISDGAINGLGDAVKGELFDVPSAAAHTYKVAAFVNATSTTVKAGLGGAGALNPAFLRVTKA